MKNLNMKIEELKEDLIRNTQNIIKIKSVESEPKEGKPFGEEVSKALDFTLNLCTELGFKTVNLDGYIGYAEYGIGEEYVGVLGHLDVVPEGDGWIYPPYGAEIHDGKIFGRGTTDDKGPMIAALYGLKAIKELNIPLSKKVRIIFGTNEESGCKEMEYYNEREKPPILGFTPDGEYPIIYAEKGITIFDLVKDFKVEENQDIEIQSIKGGHRPNMVPDFCQAIIKTDNSKIVLDCLNKFKEKNKANIVATTEGNIVTIKSYGKAAHGSLPQLGENAIMQLLKFIGKISMKESQTKQFIDFCNKHIGLEVNGESFGIGLCDEVSGKLSFNVGTIDLDKEKVSMALNLRYPVTFKYDDMMTPLNKTLENTEIRIENMIHQEPLYFEKEHPLIKTLQKVYEEETGLEPELLAIGGGTYAKEMKNIVAFGPIFKGEPDLDHQANEYIKVDDLVKNAKIYGKAIYELAK
ncbi:MAG: dipeptidase PepV [Clostridiaceae bacterium]